MRAHATMHACMQPRPCAPKLTGLNLAAGGIPGAATMHAALRASKHTHKHAHSFTLIQSRTWARTAVLTWLIALNSWRLRVPLPSWSHDVKVASTR